MTRRVFEKLCTKKVCVDFLAPIQVLSGRLSRRCFKSVKVMIDTIWCCQNQSISLGRRMDGSGHLDSQMSLQALKIRSFMRFTCSTGSLMQSITSTISGWLMASCSTVTPSQVMEDTTSTQGHSEAKSKTFQKCQRSQGQGSSGSSSIRIQWRTRLRSSTRTSSFASSSPSIRSGQQRRRCSTSIRLLHRSRLSTCCITSQLRSQIGISQRPSWRSCSILKFDSLRESSRSFEAVILTWKLFSYQVVNFVNQSPNWKSTAASQSWTRGSICGKSRSHPHHQWRSMTQHSGSVERGAQDQLLVQQSSPSVQAGSHSGELMSSQGAWFGHSQHLKFHVIIK